LICPRNLRLGKYQGGEEEWDFVFRHPLGGVGRIMVYRETSKTVSVFRLWWVDDFKRLTRYHKKDSINRIRPTRKDLLPVLEDSLHTIAKWQKKELRFGTKLSKRTPKELREARDYEKKHTPVPVIEA
jgi:hypothetical protein